MNNKVILLLKEAGAWHEGHTEFRNGLHGNGWTEKDAIVRNPKYLDRMSQLQAQNISNKFPEVNLLIGPVTGGAVIASYVARHLGTEFGIILGKQEPIVFHDMNIPKSGQKVVLTEDIISSGTDIRRFIKFLKQENTDVVGVSVWINRNEGQIEGVKATSLLPPPFELYEKDHCPLCAGGIDIQYADVRE